MSQGENASKSSSEAAEDGVASTNLFAKGNTPFRRGVKVGDTNGSPTRNAKTSENSGKNGTLKEVAKNDSQDTLTPSESVTTVSADSESTLNVEEISKEIPSFTASLATFEKEWNSIIDKYSNVEDQGDVVDLASGRIVENNGHIELLEDEEDTIWDSMFPKQKEEDTEESTSRPPTPSLLQQLGEFHSDSEEEEKTTKKRRISLWDV
ncbi:Protein SCM3 [Yarrowia sp. B02]|nr:Protein SCM3 [Yarrowia sp. B02]